MNMFHLDVCIESFHVYTVSSLGLFTTNRLSYNDAYLKYIQKSKSTKQLMELITRLKDFQLQHTFFLVFYINYFLFWRAVPYPLIIFLISAQLTTSLPKGWLVLFRLCVLNFLVTSYNRHSLRNLSGQTVFKPHLYLCFEFGFHSIMVFYLMSVHK